MQRKLQGFLSVYIDVVCLTFAGVVIEKEWLLWWEIRESPCFVDAAAGLVYLSHL